MLVSTGQEFVIDPGFRSLIPPLRLEERQQLEANLITEGCRDPLVVWSAGRVLLDGHNRFDICNEHDLPYTVVELDFDDREDAADWIDRNQLGRRNLNPDQYSLLRGRRHLRAKSQGKRTDKTSAQNEQKSSDTAERLAKEHGVSRATIVRDGQFAEAVEVIKQVDPQIEAKVVAGSGPAKGAVVEAAKVITKAQAEIKSVASTPLIPTRKDREAAEVLQKAKEKAAAILNGELGTIAQARREVIQQERREALQARALEVQKSQDLDIALPWEVRQGDALEGLASLQAGTVRLIFTDPPYNIGVDYGDGVGADSRPAQEYLGWCRRWMDAAARALTPDGSMWVLICDEWADEFGCILRRSGLHRRSWIKWYESFGVNTSNNFNRCSRHLFYMVKDPDRFVFDRDAVSRPSDRQVKYNDSRADPAGKTWDDVWGINPQIPRLVGNAAERIPDFPTQLPLQLLMAVVGCASEPGDLVVDPFNGSGTTGAASIRLGRRYIGIEQSEKFASLSRLRLTTTTEDHHVHVSV